MKINLIWNLPINDDQRACVEARKDAHKHYYEQDKSASTEEERCEAWMAFCKRLDDLDARWPQYEFLAGG